MERAVALALAAEAQGNLPVGAVIVLDGQRIAEGACAVLSPIYHPGRHAEQEALKAVAPALWPRAAEMVCYTTLEPCMMCFGALLLHGIGRVVFGALDVQGGSGVVLPHLPAYYANRRGVFAWEGPIMAEVCDPLYARTDAGFATLPCGRTPRHL